MAAEDPTIVPPPDHAIITLSNGMEARVDLCDRDRLANVQWHAFKTSRSVYAKRNAKRGCGTLMHRIILDIRDPRQDVDHINGDGLDNRRANLRLATRAQNNANQRKTRGSSRFKGVSWCPDRGKWQAIIRPHRTSRSLGRFATEEEAARAYDDAAVVQWGAFARLNFPLEQALEAVGVKAKEAA